MGYSLETNNTTRTTYEHVKRVAVIGAGVAGLQLAERLGKKPGLEVTIFEKTRKVGGVWSANYADFGLQVGPPPTALVAADCLALSATGRSVPTGSKGALRVRCVPLS